MQIAGILVILTLIAPFVKAQTVVAGKQRGQLIAPCTVAAHSHIFHPTPPDLPVADNPCPSQPLAICVGDGALDRTGARAAALFNDQCPTVSITRCTQSVAACGASAGASVPLDFGRDGQVMGCIGQE